MTDPAVFRCHLCGQRTKLHTDGEGTSHYEGVAERECERLREVLVLLYREYPALVASVCDENIDTSGRLLGEIRDAVLVAPPARVNNEDGS